MQDSIFQSRISFQDLLKVFLLIEYEYYCPILQFSFVLISVWKIKCFISSNDYNRRRFHFFFFKRTWTKKLEVWTLVPGGLKLESRLRTYICLTIIWREENPPKFSVTFRNCLLYGFQVRTGIDGVVIPPALKMALLYTSRGFDKEWLALAEMCNMSAFFLFLSNS